MKTITGAGFLKPHTDQFSMIDMSVNQEGLKTLLLIDVMDAERPDFANHQHSVKADIRGHNKMLQETHVRSSPHLSSSIPFTFPFAHFTFPVASITFLFAPFAPLQVYKLII